MKFETSTAQLTQLMLMNQSLAQMISDHANRTRGVGCDVTGSGTSVAGGGVPHCMRLVLAVEKGCEGRSPFDISHGGGCSGVLLHKPTVPQLVSETSMSV